VACGLGGGSLVNAGVMIPAPVRARRHPKWPKEWERNWESCEASAAAMLKIQSVPLKFPSAKILEEVAYGKIGETFDTSVKLSMNFDIEEPITKGMKAPPRGSCLACGNCLSGCPYNAKSSTDKNYILSAIQACLNVLCYLIY
jgi:ferredoxin